MLVSVFRYLESDTESRHVRLRNLVVGTKVHSPVQASQGAHSVQPSGINPGEISLRGVSQLNSYQMSEKEIGNIRLHTQ